MDQRLATDAAARGRDVRFDGRVVRVVSPAPRAAWEQVLAEDPGAMLFQCPRWLDCICRVDGWQDASRLYETGDGRLLVLPMVRRPGRPSALSVQASFPPGWGTGGILAPGGVRPGETAMVLADLAADRALRTSLRPNFAAAEAWPVRVPAAVCVERSVHVLDLDGGMDAYWSQRLSRNGRQQLRSAQRKAEQAGLVIGTGRETEAVAAFYDLYLRWLENRARERHLPPALVRNRGRRAEPLAKFEAVAASFPEACRIRVARVGGVPVAATIILVHGSVCVYWRGFSDKQAAGPVHANQLLQLSAIEQACEAGCRYYEMGESGGVRSLEDFKSRLGARERQLTEYRFERLPFTWVEDRLDGLRGAVAGRLAGRRG